MKIRQLLESRTLSTVPISIGTGLALETILDIEPFDTEREIPHFDVSLIREVTVNLHTLVRNIIQALPTAEKKYILSKQSTKFVTEVVYNEIDILQSLLAEKKLEFDICIPNWTLLKTFNQIEFKNTQLDQIKALAMSVEKQFNFKPYERTNRGMILTHIPSDLLVGGKYYLLESHTGRVLQQHEFNRKYKKVANTDFTILPFNKHLLKIFGDSSRYFAPYSLKDRVLVYNHLVSKGVNPMKSNIWIEEQLKRIEIT